MAKKILILSFFSLLTLISYAGNPPPAKKIVAPDKYSFLTDSEFFLAMAILIFGVIAIVFQFFLLRKDKSEYGIKLYVVTVLVVVTVFLIPAGFSKEQMSPVMGLLGTIAGYLLGHLEKKSAD